ncbi:MAG: hypothetical protein J7515_12845 [Caulobacter sp.]|nr:hypothetical protein [Caulobacter sp.]
MSRTLAALGLILLLAANLAACGESPMGASEGGSAAPADAPASTPPGPDFSGDFDLTGTEPFWSGRIQADGLTLSRAGQPDVSTANTGAKVEGDVGVWGVGGLVFRLHQEPCSDGMSDRKYDYRAEVTINGQTLKGCASALVDTADETKS